LGDVDHSSRRPHQPLALLCVVAAAIAETIHRRQEEKVRRKQEIKK
jgi:hypothetical protein